MTTFFSREDAAIIPDGGNMLLKIAPFLHISATGDGGFVANPSSAGAALRRLRDRAHYGDTIVATAFDTDGVAISHPPTTDD